MSKHLPVVSVLSLTITALLAGCGDGGSSHHNNDSGSQPATKTLAVKAVDGYLKNARVWLDINGNGALDANEPTANSDASGTATLDVTAITDPAQYRVLVEAIAGTTTDVGDGTAAPTAISKNYVMSAPAGVTTVTPLTTLVEQSMSASGLSQAAAVQEVATRLGLSSADSADLLGDFIADKKTTAQVYAGNLVQVLGSTLDNSKATALLDSGATVGKALSNYLAANPVTSSSDAAAVKVVLDSSGTVTNVIKDSDGDGHDDASTGGSDNGSNNGSNNGGTGTGGSDNGSNNGGTSTGGTDSGSNNGGTSTGGTDSGSNNGGTSTGGTDSGSNNGGTATSETLASFLSTSNAFFLVSDNGDNTLWGDHWKAAGSGVFSWADSEIFAKVGQYFSDPSMNEVSYLLSDTGWTEVKDSDDIHITSNSDGSIDVTNADGVKGGKMSSQCQDISGKTQASLLSHINSISLPVASSAVFSSGAVGCITHFVPETDTHYYIHNWTDGENAVYLGGNHQATSLDELFSSEAPVADSNGVVSNFSNGIPVYKQDTQTGNLMLVLVRANSSDTHGVGQLWQYNQAVGGYQLLSNITSADHQGWSLVTKGNAKVVVLSDTIRQWLSGGDVVGYTVWQDRVQLVDLNDGEQNNTLLILNPVGYQDMMAGRVLDTAHDDGSDNAGAGSSDSGNTDTSGSAGGSDNTATPADPAAAAAFVALINTHDAFYSLYDEHGVLGIAEVNGDNWQSYMLDFNTGDLTKGDAGVSPLTVTDNNHVLITDGNEISDTVCNEVRDLAGTPIAGLLKEVTSTSQLTAMRTLFANTVFSAGAKAYINLHTDAEGSGTEIVLNQTAYNDVLQASHKS